MVRKVLLFTVIFLLALALGSLYGFYLIFHKPNVKESDMSYIVKLSKSATFPDLQSYLKDANAIQSEKTFTWAASLRELNDQSIKPGYYEFNGGLSNLELIRIFKGGLQTPIKLVINNHRTLDDLFMYLETQIDVSNEELYQALHQWRLRQNDTSRPESDLSLFIPNTYEIYYTTSAESFISRMIKEHDNFWTASNRDDKAIKINMTREEVYTLASIVEKESQHKPERPRVAGVYLNRLRKGMLLQADPTVVFATGKFDLRRVLYEHLEIDSPYNTYKYSGLPPGPIYMPSINSIDAVLNAEDHDYLFFCAEPGYDGKHAFAKTLAEHSRNARKYHAWLSSQKIK
jgi:UPF0755 protein